MPGRDRYAEHADTLGPRIRALRAERRLTLRQLAAEASLSASLLSDIERGKVNPSVTSFFRIAAALGVTPHNFFPEESPKRPPNETGDEADIVLRRANRSVIPLVGGIRWQRLTPRLEGAVEFIEMQYDPGASSGEAMHHHPGREYGLVLEGELTLDLGFEQHTLRVGDSVAFDSATPHRLSNLGRKTLRLAWVNVNTPTGPGSTNG